LGGARHRWSPRPRRSDAKIGWRREHVSCGPFRLRGELQDIIEKIWAHCERSGTRGRTVTLKVKFANFRQITRRRTGQLPIGTRGELEQLSNALLAALFPVAKGIRLLGISLSSLAAAESERRPETSLSL